MGLRSPTGAAVAAGSIALVVAFIAAVVWVINTQPPTRLWHLPSQVVPFNAQLSFTLSSFDPVSRLLVVKVAAVGSTERDSIPLAVDLVLTSARPGAVTAQDTTSSTVWRYRLWLKRRSKDADSLSTKAEATTSPRGAFFEAELSLRMYFDPRRFPYDSMFLGLDVRAIDTGIQPVHDQRPSILLENRLADYPSVALKSRADVRGRLRRGWQFSEDATFAFVTRARDVRRLAVAFLLIGFLSAGVLIQQAARKRDVELPVIGYLLSLWAVRGAFMGLVEGTKPFPSLIDLGVLFLFLFSLIGVWIARSITAPAERTKWPP